MMAFDLDSAVPVRYPAFDLSSARPVDDVAPAKPARQPSYLERGALAATKRAATSAAGGFNRGLAGILGTPVDTVLNIADLGRAAYGSAAAALGRSDLAPGIPDRSRIIGSSENIARGLSRITSVEPASNSAIDRYAFAAGTGASGALASPRNALPGLLRALTGGVAAQGVNDLGGSSGAQVLANLLASSSPEALRGGAKFAVRGGEEGRQQVRNTLAAFSRMGVMPSAGQATERRPMQAIESVLSGIPGGAGVMTRFAEGQQAKIGAGADRIADSLSPRASAERTGAKIQSGVEDAFIPAARATQRALYAELDQRIPGKASVSVANTRATLHSIVGGIPSAPAVSSSSLIRNNVAADLLQAIEQDAPTGTLPYDAIKRIRTRVGEKLDDYELAPDVPRQQLKKVYGALTEDMRAAAKRAGPQAEAAFNRANTYTRALHERIDTLQRVVDKAGGPEKVFQAATSGAGDGATTLRAVMKSLPEEGQRALSASVIRRLGRATPGRQDDTGSMFSTESFLTNWSKLSPEAKSVITGPHGPEFRADVEALAKVASNLRQGSKVYANPSGTASKTAAISAGTGLGGSLAFGNYAAAGGILGSITAANLAARLLTNQGFVRSLGEITRLPPEAIASQLGSIAVETDNR